MIKTGIDTIALYTSRYALDLTLLANAHAVPENKYFTSLGQLTMAVPPPGEDIVTMAANAGHRALSGIEVNEIAMLLFATESGIDQSKAAGLYVHHLLNLSPHCRVVELKQACYSATFALQTMMPFLREHPDKKILLIASDIARYGLNTTGESSQGAGACAMVLAANPRLMAIDPEYGVMSESVMDFWRPNYAHEALVDGKYSSRLYLTMLEKSYQHYQQASKRRYTDHAYFCYHTPVPRLVEKAHHHLLKINGISENKDEAAEQVAESLQYARLIGNSYSASLYVSIASLLDHVKDDLADKRIGLYSYGSGCVAEYFSGVVEKNYREHLHTNYHQALINTRSKITYQDYTAFYNFKYVEDGTQQEIPQYNTGIFKLTRLIDHQRIYERVPDGEDVSQQRIVSDANLTQVVARVSINDAKPALMRREAHINTRIYAPAKLILSGEHSVVHGGPALAMAINRYAVATVNVDEKPDVGFDLTNLAHQSRLSFNALQLLKNKVKQNYHRFIRGDFSIRDVLQKPFELAYFALSLLADTLNIALPQGVTIKLESNIPIGCGMGSSAATILSVLRAITQHLNLNLTEEELFKLALEAENMQHGNSSGLDLRIALKGGCIYMCGQEIAQRIIPTFPLYLVNTGTPQSTTGQCVAHTASYFRSSQLKDDFASVTNAMDEALQLKSWSNLQETLRHNHELLTRIGVVPQKIQEFVASIEMLDGAAKLCGAGAITGDQGGALLVAHQDKTLITEQVERFGYNIIPIQCDLRGVHAA